MTGCFDYPCCSSGARATKSLDLERKPSGQSSQADTSVARGAAAPDRNKSRRAATALFDKLGGAEAIKAAVDLFYSKLIRDPEVAPFFKGVDLSTLMRKQVQFMTLAFGGEANYTGMDVAAAHKHLIDKQGVDETHFDIVAGHFSDTLTELGVAPDVRAEAVGVVATLRPIFEKAKA